MQVHAAFSLRYPSTAPSLQSTIVHCIRVGISEVKLCTSIDICVQGYFFYDLSWRGTAPANSQSKNRPLCVPYACAQSVTNTNLIHYGDSEQLNESVMKLAKAQKCTDGATCHDTGSCEVLLLNPGTPIGYVITTLMREKGAGQQGVQTAFESTTMKYLRIELR
ncbi:hypothetical protein EVAR_9423_1 [Eumeta japonica]|uniref:Uncharacterized protein n=1 Tax=Eumeta variegata TaxID=151549 RepID=A0A4C1UD04_EUMVA|nr:hypothetical protein EVAR_9423_1 [Eumeta japonica]